MIDLELMQKVTEAFCTPKGRVGIQKCFDSYNSHPHESITEGMQFMIESTRKPNPQEAIGYISGLVLGFFIAQHTECMDVEEMLRNIVDFTMRAEDTKVIDFAIAKRRLADGKGDC